MIGNPTFESWADGLKLARDINYQFPQVRYITWILLFLVISLWDAICLINVLGVITFYSTLVCFYFLQLAGVHLSALIPSASDDAISLVTVSSFTFITLQFTPVPHFSTNRLLCVHFSV